MTGKRSFIRQRKTDMKNSRKEFILTEAVLAFMIVIVAFVMFREKNSTQLDKISVIIQDSDDSRWAAFKYGLRMAAADQGVEVFVASTEHRLSASQLGELAQAQLNLGADALIIQPVLGEETEAVLEALAKKTPVVLAGPLPSGSEAVYGLPFVGPDNYEIGRQLALELLSDYRENLDGKMIGIVSEAAESQAAADRERGFREAIEGYGGKILWSVTGFGSSLGKNVLQQQAPVDFVAAMDNSSAMMAGQEALANNLHGALVYGIGCSTEAVYYLDAGKMECLIVPDEFHVGYQSLMEAVRKMERFFSYEMQDRTVSYTVLRRENLFSKENQEIIFTMNQ